MYLLPAIDLLDGRAVRLAKGDYHAVTVYNDDPAYQAQLFEEAGATWLHVVDLDGAKSGNPDNLEVVRAILARTSLKVEVGGGVRSLEAADRLLDAGATRVILGTALVRDPDFAQAAMEKFGPDALVAGIDAKAGEAAVAGWTEGSGVAARPTWPPHGGAGIRAPRLHRHRPRRHADRRGERGLREDGRRLWQSGHRFRRHRHRS